MPLAQGKTDQSVPPSVRVAVEIVHPGQLPWLPLAYQNVASRPGLSAECHGPALEEAPPVYRGDAGPVRKGDSRDCLAKELDWCQNTELETVVRWILQRPVHGIEWEHELGDLRQSEQGRIQAVVVWTWDDGETIDYVGLCGGIAGGPVAAQRLPRSHRYIASWRLCDVRQGDPLTTAARLQTSGRYMPHNSSAVWCSETACRYIRSLFMSASYVPNCTGTASGGPRCLGAG